MKAGLAIAMGEMGYPESVITKATNIPERTVWGLLHDEVGWIHGPVLKVHRVKAKEILQARSMAIAEKCLNQVDKKIVDASAYQAAGIYGLLRTHERLDAGEPTEHIAMINRHQIEGLDRLAERLGQALIAAHKEQDDLDCTR